MPSGDNSSGSDIDPGGTVRYALECDYPERINFGPDKHGAFFGDVELGRIVQEEQASPDVHPSHSTLLSPSKFEYSRSTSFTPVTIFTPSSSLLNRSNSQAESSLHTDPSSQSYCESHSSQLDRASYIAERVSFINDYSESYNEPEALKLTGINENNCEPSQPASLGPPPDYVRISIVLLLLSPPCAGIALYWALKAKQHMLKGENRKAWQLSNKAFYCLLLGLFCFFIVLMSWSVAALFSQFKRNHEKTLLKTSPNPNSNKYDARSQTRAMEENVYKKRDGHQDKSQNLLLSALVSKAKRNSTSTRREKQSLSRSHNHPRDKVLGKFVATLMPWTTTTYAPVPENAQLITTIADSVTLEDPEMTHSASRSGWLRVFGDKVQILPVKTTTTDPRLLQWIPVTLPTNTATIKQRQRPRRHKRILRPRGKRRRIES